MRAFFVMYFYIACFLLCVLNLHVLALLAEAGEVYYGYKPRLLRLTGCVCYMLYVIIIVSQFTMTFDFLLY